ncbi:MAG: HNH endonuclease [Phycisphaerales bacterium]
MKKRLRHEKERKAKETRQRSRGKKMEIRTSVPAKRRVPRRLPRVPPPESEVWPEEYRGENWKPIYAILFAGKCQLCAHSCPLPNSRQVMDKWSGMTRLLHCTNHPAHPGGIAEVLPTDTCRNFKEKAWHWEEKKRTQAPKRWPKSRPGHKIERVPVGHGLFATVDATDYPEISKYKWHAARYGRKVYALSKRNGRTISMHRMLMRPRKGYIVDHKDGNSLNNCRDNLRVCTRQQNQANRRSTGGTSRFVGVYRRGNQWVAQIQCRCKWYYVGLFDNEVEAAKARDRKAYELLGEYAYLNFPEDFRGRRRRRR